MKTILALLVVAAITSPALAQRYGSYEYYRVQRQNLWQQGYGIDDPYFRTMGYYRGFGYGPSIYNSGNMVIINHYQADPFYPTYYYGF